ncbi:MAG: hypothetical protein QXN59_00645 [Candidatus Micrarchaeaceae archaeon]
MAAYDYYVKAMDRFTKNSKRLYCTFCGAESLAFGNFGICRVCEAPLSEKKSDVLGRDHSLVESGEAIWSAINRGDMDNAIAALNSRLASHDEPGFLFAAGLFYIRYSNEEIKKIRYDREGFMEENAVHRENSEKMMLYAKTLLNKAVKLAEKDKGNQGMLMHYIPFLAEIKLGHLKAAMYYLKGIKHDDIVYLLDYAHIVAHAYRKDGEKLLEHCDRMIREGKVNLNIFYYIGYALFLKKAYGDAKVILSHLSETGEVDAASYLLRNINNLYGIRD